MIKSVVVFCSSSNQVAPIYFSEIERLASELARQKFRIVYGGGRSGLMGRLADTALAHGGEVIGVIPQYLAKPEILHPSLTDLLVVDDLLDRKKRMLALADAAIASPGGFGTIDEITEVIALKQLHEHKKPIFFHNFLNFWDPFFVYLEELRARHMIHDELKDLYTAIEEAPALVQALKVTPAPVRVDL
jgi:uncharacterized protein (TIGR00730 family)